MILAVVVAMALLAGVLLMLASGGPGRPTPTGVRVSPYLLTPEDVAAVTGWPADTLEPADPGIDLDRLESQAQQLTFGRAPLPDDRAIVSYREPTAGAQVTSAVLLYDDPARAQQLVGLVDQLPPGVTLAGLVPADQVATVPGGTDATRWTATGYRAVTFRRDGVVVFVGVADPDGTIDLEALAARAATRVEAAPPPPPPTPP
jgi:hypothetical protein